MTEFLTELENSGRGTDLGDEGNLRFEEQWKEAGCLRRRWRNCGLMETAQLLGSSSRRHNDSQPYSLFFIQVCSFKTDAWTGKRKNTHTHTVVVTWITNDMAGGRSHTTTLNQDPEGSFASWL